VIDEPLTPASCAASLILMRDRRSGPPELLIVQRSAALAFAAGAFAFPGGRIDAVDGLLAARLAPELDADDGAARIAAVRETIEETGIAVALSPHPDPATIAAWRAGGMAGLAERADIRFDPAALTPFARWLPNERIVRRFDTRFYLAEALDDWTPDADGTETNHAFWMTAEAVLDRCARQDGRALFPTRRLLERVARFATIADARDEALRLPHRIISPWIDQRPDGRYLCVPDDAGYPVSEERIETAMRS
jgi:8-oxo-dGTP pyrophosphatase MutT (NUDIX family)